LDINGTTPFDGFGESLALSADGATIVIGAPTTKGPIRTAGYAQVYTIHTNDSSNDRWVPVGPTIWGEAVDDFFGFSVAMSDNGTTIGIGAVGNDGSALGGGHVRAYGSQKIDGQWIQCGNDIDGADIDDRSGYSIAKSANGNTIVVGAPFHACNDVGDCNGRVRVYSTERVSGQCQWNQIGSDIVGTLDETGNSVAMSADGKTIAISAPENDENGDRSGRVRVYSIAFTPGRWTQVGNNLNGAAINQRFGQSLAMSKDGRTIAIHVFVTI
jgi:hypothetical protein